MPPRRRARLSAYRAAQIAARKRTAILGRAAVSRMQKTVSDFADEVARLVANIPASEVARIRAGTVTFTAGKDAARRLGASALGIVESGRELTFAEVQALWTETAVKIATERGLDPALTAGIRNPPLTMLGVYESLGPPSTTWRSLLPQYARAAGSDVDQIVTRAIAEGIGPDKLARQLRPYVKGAEPFNKALGPLLKEQGIQLGTFRGTFADGARQMVHNSSRIAFSELHNTRAEAEAQSFALDPMVRMIGWRLAPDRGTLSGPDECDALAFSDFYGLGAGNYPVSDVPSPPHPWDRCERVPIVGRTSQAGTAKPLPPRQGGGESARFGRRVTTARATQIRDRVDRHLSASDSVNERLRELVRAAV